MSILDLFRVGSERFKEKHLLAVVAVLIYSKISDVASAVDERFNVLTFLLSAALALIFSAFS